MIYEAIHRAVNREPLFSGVSAVLLLLLVPTAIAYTFDSRTVDGLNVWLKPLKFELSLAVFCATLVLFTGLLPKGVLEASSYRAFTWSIAAAIALEVIWLVSASWIGVRSHFNGTEPMFRTVYPVMGLIAVYLASVTLVYGVLILSSRPSAYGAAVGFGFVVTFVLTVVIAGALATSDATLGGSPNGTAPWRALTTDLRAAHFLATHAVLFVAGFAFALERLVPRFASFATSAGIAFVFSAAVLSLFIAVLRSESSRNEALSVDSRLAHPPHQSPPWNLRYPRD